MPRITIFNTPFLSAAFRGVSRLYLRAIGWKKVGMFPADTGPYVVIAAPHTSNWDFPLMLAMAFLLRSPMAWMGKDALFAFPFGRISRWLGGLPIDRKRANGVVPRSIDLLQSGVVNRLVIPAEGTRAWTPYWKSGFYHIARGAGVPVVLSFLDYETKTGGIGPTVILTGDASVDMARIREFYGTMKGKFPSRMGPIMLTPTEAAQPEPVSAK